MRIIYIVLLCFVALSGKTIEDSSTSLKIVQPFDKTRYIGENSTFIIDTTFNLVDTIVIKQDNNLTTEVKVNSTKKTYCKTIKLHTAQNSISVSSYKNGKLVNTIERDLYFLSELFEGVDEDEAEDYKLRYLHNDKNEEKCKSCHNMKSNIPTNGEAFEDVSKTTCYECHKGMINTKNTHAPTANWLCLDCHNGKYAEYNMDQEGKSKYLAPNPIAKTCTSCHETVKKWTESKYTHGPVNDGRCERCHNPHGSDNDFFLRKPIWELCTTCHAEKADGKHVVSSFVFSRNSGAHPTKGVKDPARPSRDLTCSGCHNPHGSSGVFLLRMKGSMSFGVCNRCHKK
ncbi:cytochrome c3 family protein [Sulfurimonas sp. CS5]|uniref:cytochrome c3 family protein n=1 Tax=Sulfurimonas sp. CS5 TaxID=3391145 RepID=UPI0039E81722